MRPRRWAPAVIALVLALSACGAEQPIADGKGFHRAGEDARVFGAYRQATKAERRTVSLPAGTQHVRVRMDCVGHGDVRVDVFGGEVGVPCGDTSQRGGSLISLTKDAPVAEASTTPVVVRAPAGSTWSVAVDAGPGTIDPALER